MKNTDYDFNLTPVAGFRGRASLALYNYQASGVTRWAYFTYQRGVSPADKVTSPIVFLATTYEGVVDDKPSMQILQNQFPVNKASGFVEDAAIVYDMTFATNDVLITTYSVAGSAEIKVASCTP